MGIYSYVTPAVDQEYVSSKAITIMGMESNPELHDGMYIVSEENRTFEVDTRDGSIHYVDHSKLYNVTGGNTLPSPEVCRTIADLFLNERDLLPSSFNYSSTSTFNASAFNPVSEETLTKVLHYQVDYNCSIGEYAIRGPGAQISVVIGDEGEVISFDYNWRNLVQHSSVQVIEYNSLLSMNGISPNDVQSHSLCYYAGTDEDDENLLVPRYEVLVDAGENVSSIPLLLQATEIAPIVTIVSPENAVTSSSGSTLTFNCSVFNGVAPFTYVWSSDIDGDLSTHQSFSTSSLSSLVENNAPIPHTISIIVEDANGLVATDSLTVMITDLAQVDLMWIIVGLVAIGLISLLVVMRKKRGHAVLLLALALLSAFVCIPVASASSDVTGDNPVTSKRIRLEESYDDRYTELGAVYVGYTHPRPLPYAKWNTVKFYEHMTTTGGYDPSFLFGEYAACEYDFKSVNFNGMDAYYSDAVDFLYYNDHGGPDGFSFSAERHYTFFHYSNAEWGDGDLEFIVTDACSVLKWENPDTGKNIWDRWAPAFKGLHIMCGFATGSHDTRNRGLIFARYLTRGYRMMTAWFRACAETEDSRIVSAILYATKSVDAWNPSPDDPVYDHAHGFGFVASDPTPTLLKWFIYLTSPC
jgi:hypothetical protein